MTIEELRERRLLPLFERVAAEHHVTVDELRGRGRTKAVVAARKKMTAELRLLGLSWPEVGNVLGRDHTAVMNLAKTMPKDPTYRLREAEKLLRAALPDAAPALWEKIRDFLNGPTNEHSR